VGGHRPGRHDGHGVHRGGVGQAAVPMGGHGPRSVGRATSTSTWPCPWSGRTERRRRSGGTG
jgi:hypothetical protein